MLGSCTILASPSLAISPVNTGKRCGRTRGTIPIGRPFNGVNLRFLARMAATAPVGVVGNIFAGLRYLAAGYWRDPAMTARCFLPGPNGTRIFHGGDMAFSMKTASSCTQGAETPLIRSAVSALTLPRSKRVCLVVGIDDIAVVPAPRANGELHLVAYVVPGAGLTLSSRRMRNAARTFLPRHLVPSLFVSVDALPDGKREGRPY